MDGGEAYFFTRARDARHGAIGAADLAHIEIRRMNPRLFRQSLMELHRQILDRVLELASVRSVPGDDGIEHLHCIESGRIQAKLEQIEPRGGDGADLVGKAYEGYVRLGYPDLGVIRAEMLQCRQRDDAVANGTGSDEKAFQFLTSTGTLISTVLGGRQALWLQA